MKLSVIIPTYNGLHQLETISSLLRLTSEEFGEDCEIIVVDNGSNDSSVELLKSMDFIKTIQLTENGGFTKAVNEGARIAKGDYLLILNNDCIFETTAVKKMIEFLDHHLEYVATQPVILKPDKTIEQIGYIVDLKVARATVVTQKDFEFERFKNQKDIFITGKMFGLSGTCLLIRKNEFISIRMLDESFHSYLEDIDLSMRLALSGYSYAPCLESSVIHEHMATSRKMGSYKEWHDLTNWIKIIIKNYPKWFIFVNLPSLCIERMRNISGFLKKKYAKNV